MNIPLNIDIQQIFLHIFNFVLLALGLYILLYKPVKNFMDKRSSYYEDMDREARENLASAEAMKAEYTEKLSHAEEEIAKSKADAARSIDAETERRLSEADKKSAKILSDAAADARAEKAKILASAHEDISEMIVTAAEKLMLNSPTDSSEIFDRFLNSVGEDSDADGENK